jgi:hypothetical protein
MADNSKKVSELPTAANAVSTDRVVILRDPAGSPSLRTIAINNLAKDFVFSNSVPTIPNSNGVVGTIRCDSSYIYVCTANNTWKRSALTTW